MPSTGEILTELGVGVLAWVAAGAEGVADGAAIVGEPVTLIPGGSALGAADTHPASHMPNNARHCAAEACCLVANPLQRKAGIDIVGRIDRKRLVPRGDSALYITLSVQAPTLP